MSLLNEGEDVLEFIDSKKMNFKQVELKSTIIHYSKIITKSMIYSYTRMENIDNCFKQLEKIIQFHKKLIFI